MAKNQGIRSNKLTRPGVRTGTGGKAANPGGVSQLGQRVGDHITEGRNPTRYRGEPLHKGSAYNPVKFGNEVALNVGKGGCGTGRVLYGQAGSQGVHGPVAGTPKQQGRDILSEFGGESKPRR